MREHTNIRRLWIPIFLGLILWFGGLYGKTVLEAEEKLLLTAGPSWERFTNRDGHGLYHDIIRQIFRGYTIRHIYVATEQANSMVALGRADIKMCDTEVVPPLTLGRYQMYENDFHVVFKKDRVEPWRGVESLVGKRLVWREGYYSQSDFPVMVDHVAVRTGKAALKMVLLGRAEYYVDDKNLIEESFQGAGVHFDPRHFGLEKAGARRYYPVFSDTPRARMLQKVYERGMERLYREGTLQQIYRYWGFPVPDFEFDNLADR